MQKIRLSREKLKNMITEKTSKPKNWREKYLSIINRNEKRELKNKVLSTIGIQPATFYYWVNGTNRCQYDAVINNIFGIEPDDENNNTITK